MKKLIFIMVSLGLSLNASAKDLSRVNANAKSAIKKYLSDNNAEMVESNTFLSPETQSNDPRFAVYYVSLDALVKLSRSANPTLVTCTVLVREEIANPRNVSAIEDSVECTF